MKPLERITDYQNNIHSSFIFQNCFKYLILFFPKEIEKKLLSDKKWRKLNLYLLYAIRWMHVILFLTRQRYHKTIGSIYRNHVMLKKIKS